ncbi:uncharacterized protein LOC130697920 [Daphnia carinata]|uniref:uncharacterized protein LOC130697920 n=1 Tax=Daphnia carinata TaxID=120202 RepID=UPI00257A32C3|nr:uncharacterized protein LOC130697920 [Daphnia carinata]
MFRRSVCFDTLWLVTGLAVFLPWHVVVPNEAPQHNNGRLFRENLQRLQTLGMCGIPRPRVHYVEDHPEADATLTYHPTATVLHWCDPSGGCCRDRRKRCSPLEETIVRIVFFVHSIHPVNMQTSASPPANRMFQSLDFVNHTQCICADINDVPRR